jgi:GNAT superfamily N-acetyltransferase
MITELEKRDFGVVASQYGSRLRFPEARAVIEGNNPGRVFVDDPAAATALIWAQGIGGFYLAGDQSNPAFLGELDSFIDRLIAPRLGELGLDWFEVSGDRGWGPVIEAVFAHRGLEKGLQHVYTLDPFAPKSGPSSDTDYEIRQVDRNLIADPDLGKKEFLLSKTDSFWSNAETFLDLGLGFVLLRENEILSACISSFVSRLIHVVDIETLEGYRRNGYAQAVGRQFVDACLERKLWPYWDCMAENVPSGKLAEKLGFVQRDEYVLYSFRLP